MPLVLETPTRCRLPREWVGTSIEASLSKKLTYEDLRVAHELRRYQKMQKQHDAFEKGYGRFCPYFVQENGREALDKLVTELKGQRVKTALFRDEHGIWTHAGLAWRLAREYNETVVRGFKLPEPKLVPQEHKPFEPRWYQQKAEELMAGRGHAAVELATGLGKSLIIANMLHRYGLPSIVVAPTVSIAEQLYDDLKYRFGKKYVGKFFGGKKEPEKLFTVAVSASLIRVELGSKEHKALSAKQVIVGDESHLLPAETLSKVMLELFASVPYRFFVSGTQMRSDGLGVILEGIIGDVLLEMDVRKGIEGGFLNPLKFFQFEVASPNKSMPDDVIKLNRVHMHRNPRIYEHAAAAVLHALKKQGRRPLVLVEEIPQFTDFYRELWKLDKTLKVGFAHGGVDKESKEVLPERFWKSDPRALVKAFDAAELDVLVGTQCIGTGTDIKTASFIIDIVGLTSEVRLRQNVGRGTRKTPGKPTTVYVDYVPYNIEKMADHGIKRRAILDDIYGPVTVVRVK